MQPEFAQLFLAVYLAHLLADFPLQSSWIATRKVKDARALLAHGAIHLATLALCLAAFTMHPLNSWQTWLAVLVYLLTHLAIDAARHLVVVRRIARENLMLFLFDQAAHAFTAVLLVSFWTGVSFSAVYSSVNPPHDLRNILLRLGVGYVAVVFAGGYVIRYWTKPLSQGAQPEGESSDELRNAGLYIGWLERFLVLTAILVQSPAMVGLILTGKSIARFPELKKPRFAEYFLIGTLLSISLAVLGGLILSYMLRGTVSLK